MMVQVSKRAYQVPVHRPHIRVPDLEFTVCLVKYPICFSLHRINPQIFKSSSFPPDLFLILESHNSNLLLVPVPGKRHIVEAV